MAEALEELMPVGRWPSVAEAYEHSIVVLAMNRDCQVRREGEEFVLEVDPADAEPVGLELALYAEEQQAVAGPRPELPAFSLGLELAFVWAVVLTAVFLRQDIDPSLEGRFLNSSVGVFQDGEWWRPFTALFLHADGGHLLGNIFIGGFFCILACSAFGPWRGWLLILLCGTLGNLINGWIHLPGPFLSLGASTATFGALGLVVGRGLADVWRTRNYGALKPLLVPLGVGFGLFSFFGMGGGETDASVQTDVTAHIFGLVCGVVAGVLAGAAIHRKIEETADA
ncbi:serine protease, rhomboid family [Haloferula helveola]|uniref:Serine protease, rhomboid family n=2 Tax=Haloferula helveola TaxID=490095 RepID=A0ABM7RF58_9BACT|nr:serine protease, rhomboid family [Haloferula helveola]